MSNGPVRLSGTGGPEEFIEAGICWALIELSGRDIVMAQALLSGYYESWLRHGNVPRKNK